MSVDVLAISAHPDDVELACGGTLAGLAAHGRTFGIVDLTAGEMGTRGTPEIRRREAEAAGRILGAQFRETLDFGDGGLRTGRPEELALIEVIRRHRPRIVLCPFPEDRHPDHARAGRFVTEASYYSGLRKLESPSPAHRPQQIVYFSTMYEHPATFVIDVTATHAIKMEAIRTFASQFHNPESAEPATMLSAATFLAAIEARGRSSGFLIGTEFGEGFISKRPPRIGDLLAAFEGFEAGF